MELFIGTANRQDPVKYFYSTAVIDCFHKTQGGDQNLTSTKELIAPLIDGVPAMAN
jgi:hypothetical protein